MQRLLTAREMQYADSQTMKCLGIPSDVLMERAALAAFSVIRESACPGDRFLVVCGSGSNGGDGYALARLLLLGGYAVSVYAAGDPGRMNESCRKRRQEYENCGGTFAEAVSGGTFAKESGSGGILTKVTGSGGPDWIVDAIFGIGLSREITGQTADVIAQINASGARVLAMDMPSGISADTGEVLGTAVRADVTVTFGQMKRGQAIFPGADYCGVARCFDVGILPYARFGKEADAFYYERKDLPGLLPERARRSNKGTYGKLTIVGGALNMAGALLLAGRAAYRTGCGLVRLCSEKDQRVIFQSALPEAVFQPFFPEAAFDGADAVVAGPGMGQEPFGMSREDAFSFLRELLAGANCPVVLDADGLNLLAACAKTKDGTAQDDRAVLCFPAHQPGKVIITPHPGEMARLTGKSVKEILASPAEAAQEFAMEHQVICVLKDAGTIVTDGRRLYVNRSGCDAMATAGSGDVLSGVIGSLLAQGMDPFGAACLGVFLHGLAGEAARDKLGSRSVMAGDIAENLFEVLFAAEKSG